MAQNNRNNNRNNKKRGNWFDQQIQRYETPDFIKQIRPEQLVKDAIRVFRDIARGNIDVEKYGEYFLDPYFIDTCLTAANSKHVLHEISKIGIESLITSPQSANYPDAPTVHNYHMRASEGYKIIVNALVSIKMSGDIKYIYAMAAQLSRYRYDI